MEKIIRNIRVGIDGEVEDDEGGFIKLDVVDQDIVIRLKNIQLGALLNISHTPVFSHDKVPAHNERGQRADQYQLVLCLRAHDKEPHVRRIPVHCDHVVEHDDLRLVLSVGAHGLLEELLLEGMLLDEAREVVLIVPRDDALALGVQDDQCPDRGYLPEVHCATVRRWPGGG